MQTRVTGAYEQLTNSVVSFWTFAPLQKYEVVLGGTWIKLRMTRSTVGKVRGVAPLCSAAVGENSPLGHLLHCFIFGTPCIKTTKSKQSRWQTVQLNKRLNKAFSWCLRLQDQFMPTPFSTVPRRSFLSSSTKWGLVVYGVFIRAYISTLHSQMNIDCSKPTTIYFPRCPNF